MKANLFPSAGGENFRFEESSTFELVQLLWCKDNQPELIGAHSTQSGTMKEREKIVEKFYFHISCSLHPY